MTINKPCMFYGAPSYVFEKAKELRANPTEAEDVLWNYLRKNQLKDYKFRRQHPIFEFVADFYCHKTKLVVETDGEYHNIDGQKYKDKERTKIMNTFGIKVLRLYNNEVINHTDKVIKTIKAGLEKRKERSPL